MANGLLYLFRQPRHDLEQVADDPVITDLENRRVLVLVDRDDDLRRAHAGEVLDRARDPDRDVEGRGDGLSRLAHLIGVRPPARVHHGAGRSDRGAAAERPGQLLEQLEVHRLLEPAAAFTCFTTTRPAATSGTTVAAAPGRGRSTGVNTLGRSARIAGVPPSFTRSSAFPAYTGRVAVTAPRSTPTSVTSMASATPSRAATRGARSFPVALAANTTARYPPVAARSAITRAYPSGAYMPNAAFVSVITLSAPNRPSWSAPFTPPAASSKASTDPPSASASRRA